jgi:lipoprotein-anchoring transpeptidase ErfK/SrfK
MISRRRRRAAAAVALLLAAAFLVAAVARPTSNASVLDVGSADIPVPARPAFLIPRVLPLSHLGGVTRWTIVVRAVPVRSRPTQTASTVAFVSRRTPERTANVVDVVGSARNEAGQLWVAVRVPALPENVTGWVPRRVLGAYTFVNTRLVIDLGRFTATLFRDGRTVFRAPIGIGKPSSPTPRGLFYIRSKLWSLRSPFYGPLAFGTSARSQVLTDWPGGGFVGIHGTNAPELIPGRISHGCIRVRNEDVLRLGRLMPVGTPVTIR